MEIRGCSTNAIIPEKDPVRFGSSCSAFVFTFVLVRSESERIEQRRNRFTNSSTPSSASSYSNNETPSILIGTCDKLEKDYFRLTSVNVVSSSSHQPTLLRLSISLAGTSSVDRAAVGYSGASIHSCDGQIPADSRLAPRKQPIEKHSTGSHGTNDSQRFHRASLRRQRSTSTRDGNVHRRLPAVFCTFFHSG